MDEDQKVVDGEVVSSVTETATSSTSASGADTLLTITNLINNYLTQLDRDQKELTTQRQMLEDAFGNDATYKEHDDAAKAAAKIRNATKAQIMKRPGLMELSQKVKDLREDMKTTKEALSEYLQEYARLTGSRTIEGPNGDLQEIVYQAKLVKTQSRDR